MSSGPGSLPSTTVPMAPTVASSTTVGLPVVPVGFDTTVVRLTEPDGSTCERCLLVAATREERSLGLMGVTDLGGHDGMIFRYDSPVASAFWMKNTVLPLSIAFYDASGEVLETFAMDPCTADPCPTFGPTTPFLDAVEVEQGRLEELGFTATARLEILDLPCDPADP